MAEPRAPGAANTGCGAADPRRATRLESGQGLMGLTAHDLPSALDAVAPLLVDYRSWTRYP